MCPWDACTHSNSTRTRINEGKFYVGHVDDVDSVNNVDGVNDVNSANDVDSADDVDSFDDVHSVIDVNSVDVSVASTSDGVNVSTTTTIDSQ